MPLPVIPDVWRVTLNYRHGLQLIAHNVLHVLAVSDSEAAVASSFNDSVPTSGFLDCLDTSTVLESFDLIPLDGTSTQTSHALDPTENGGHAGDATVPDAVIVSLYTAQRGTRGRGRVFVPFVGEASQNGGVLVSAHREAMEDAWNTFADDLLASPAGLQLGVASYRHADFHALTSLRIQPVVGTQRRRLRQIR